MSQFYNDTDTPLFDSKENSPQLLKDELNDNEVNFIEKCVDILWKLEENARKSKSHTLSMGLLIFVLVMLCAIVIIEYFVTIENAYTKELFEFFKYVATTLIGYLFASYNKKDTE